jgi:uncharacterized membrane protein
VHANPVSPLPLIGELRMTLFILTVLIGFVAGLRAMSAPAAVAFAAYLGWLPVSGTWASFMGHWLALTIFGILALVEFVTDQLPGTPSRKVPQQFGARIISGGFSGAIIGTVSGSLAVGLMGGVIGAVLGTLGGYEARKRLVAAIGGKDLPIALLEDAVAVILALWVVSSVL